MVKKIAIIGGAALLIIIAIVVYIYQQSAYPTNESDMKQFIANGGSPDKLLLTAIDENNVEMAQYAISHGANVNALDSNYSDSAGKSDFENTPLRIALFHGQTCGNVAKVLITHGANVDYVDEAGESNLMFCTRTGDLALSSLLLNYGADPDYMNEDGESALSHAVSGEDNDPANALKIVELLLDHGAKVTDKAVQNALYLDGILASSQFPAAREMLENAYETGTIETIKVDKPLKYAFIHGETVANDYLSSQSAISKKDFKILQACAAADNSSAIKDYLKKGGDVNRTDSYGNTLLMVAAACDANRTVKLLLKYGADSSLMNSEGESADVMARKYGKTNSAMLILYERGRK